MMLDKALMINCEAMHTHQSACTNYAEWEAEVDGVKSDLCRAHFYSDADENKSLRKFVGAA